MGFLVPAFLVALGALAIPIAMHLRHRDRSKPLRFPSFMFLERLPIRTASRRRVTDLPLLLLRAAILTLLVLAFARPLAKKGNAEELDERTKALVVLLDRSMSMGHNDVWQAALDSARTAIQSLSANDMVAVVLFDDAAEVVQTLTEDHTLALAAVARATPRKRGTRFAPALRAARQQLYNAGDALGEIVVVSDLQRAGAGGIASADVPLGTAVRTAVVAAPSRANVSISSVEARRVVAGERMTLGVQARITARELAEPATVRATLTINGRSATSTAVQLPVNGDATVSFDAVPITAGEIYGVVSVDPDDLPLDDSFQFVLSREEGIKVQLIVPDNASQNETLFFEHALAIGRAPPIKVERMRASSFAGDLTDPSIMLVYWDVLPSERHSDAISSFVNGGGGVVFVAAARLAQQASTSSLVPATFAGTADRVSNRTSTNGGGGGSGSLGNVRYDHPLFSPFREASAALTMSRFLRYTRVEAAANADIVARFDDGLPAVVTRTLGKGNTVVVAVPLDDRNGDFPLQPAFLPFLRKLALYASGHDAVPLWRTTGESWAIPDAIQRPVVEAADSTVYRPDRDSVGVAISLTDAGRYAVYDGSISGEPRASVAVNVTSAESDLTPIDPKELLLGVQSTDSLQQRSVQPATSAEVERRQGIWRYLLVTVAILMVGEALFSNRGWRGSATRSAMSPNRNSR